MQTTVALTLFLVCVLVDPRAAALRGPPMANGADGVHQRTPSVADASAAAVDNRHANIALLLETWKKEDTETSRKQQTCQGLANRYEAVLQRVFEARGRLVSAMETPYDASSSTKSAASDTALLRETMKSMDDLLVASGMLRRQYRTPQPSADSEGQSTAGENLFTLSMHSEFVDSIHNVQAQCSTIGSRPFAEWLRERSAAWSSDETHGAHGIDVSTADDILRGLKAQLGGAEESDLTSVGDVKRALFLVLESWVKASPHQLAEERTTVLYLRILQDTVDETARLVGDASREAMRLRATLENAEAMVTALTENHPEIFTASSQASASASPRQQVDDVDVTVDASDEAANSESGSTAPDDSADVKADKDSTRSGDESQTGAPQQPALSIHDLFKHFKVPDASDAQRQQQAQQQQQQQGTNFLEALLAEWKKATGAASQSAPVATAASNSIPTSQSTTEAPNVVDVPWLTRQRVAASQTCDAVVDTQPAPYHSSVAALSASRKHAEACEPVHLCSPTAHFSQCPEVAYPGVLALRVAQLDAVTSLVDEALLFVYRDWDAAVEQRLSALHSAFPWSKFLVVGGDGTEGLVLERGMFDNMFDAAFPATPRSSSNDDDPRSSTKRALTDDALIRDDAVALQRRVVERGGVSSRSVRLLRAVSDDESARKPLQAVLAVHLVTDGAAVPHLTDISGPSLYFIRQRTLGGLYRGVWTSEDIRYFVYQQTAHSIVLSSFYQLHSVLRSVETALVVRVDVIGGASLLDDSPRSMGIVKMLLQDSNRLRNALGAPVYVLRVARSARTASGAVSDDAPDAQVQPDRWALDEQRNPYLVAHESVTESDIRFLNVPQAEWKKGIDRLHIFGKEGDEEEAPHHFVLFRKLLDGNETHLGVHTLAALRFPAPTHRTPRQQYGAVLGDVFQRFLRRHDPGVKGYMTRTVSAQEMSMQLSEANAPRVGDATRWVALLIAPVGNDGTAACLPAFRRAAMLQADSSPRTHVVLQVLDGSAQQELVDDLRNAAVAPASKLRTADSNDGSNACNCEVIGVDMHTRRVVRWPAMPAATLAARLARTLGDEEKAAAKRLRRTRRLAPSVMTSLLKRWTEHSDSHVAAASHTSKSLHSEWEVVAVGTRQFPVAQRRAVANSNVVGEQRSGGERRVVDIVLIHDVRCGMSIPAIKGFAQLVRCSHTFSSLFDRTRLHAVDISNVTHLEREVPWALAAVQSLSASDDVYPLVPTPVLLVGDNASHTVTLPSPWAWHGYGRSLLDVVRAEAPGEGTKWDEVAGDALSCFVEVKSTRRLEMRRALKGQHG